MIAVGLYIAYTVVKSDNTKELATELTTTGIEMSKSVKNLAKASSVYTEDLSKDFKYEALLNEIQRNDKLDNLVTNSVKSNTENNTGLTPEQIEAKNKLLTEYKAKIS